MHSMRKDLLKNYQIDLLELPMFDNYAQAQIFFKNYKDDKKPLIALIKTLDRLQRPVEPTVAKEFLKLSGVAKITKENKDKALSKLDSKNLPNLVFPNNFSNQDKEDLQMIVDGYLVAKLYGNEKIYQEIGRYILQRLETIKNIDTGLSKEMVSEVINFEDVD